MPQPKRKLVNVSVREVSLVPDGDNPGAQVLLYKARDAAPGLRERFLEKLAAVRKRLGREPTAQLRKQTYDEVLESQRQGQVYQALMGRMQALAQAIESELWFPSEASAELDPAARIVQTVQQFAASIEQDAAELLAGRLLKVAKAFDAPPDSAEFEAALREEIEAVHKGTAPSNPGPKPAKKEDDMKKNLDQILAALEPEDRATMQAELAKAKGGQGGTGDTPPDPLATLPADVRKALDAQNAARDAELAKLRTEREADRAEVEKLRKANERAEFRKSLEPLVKGLASPLDEVVDTLLDLPIEKREKQVALLKAASEAVTRAGLLGGAIGTDLPGGTGGVHKRVDAAARELMKARPETLKTIEQARAAVYLEQPELYDEFESEHAAARAH